MQSSDSITSVECTLKRLGYPSHSDYPNLWIRPRAALGVPHSASESIEVVYWKGFPRAVVTWGLHPDAVREYITGPAFAQPPPVALVFEVSGKARAFKFEEDSFQEIATVPSWKETLVEPRGRVSSTQATQVIHAIAEGNRIWLQDSRSRKVVGVLPRIFPEETVVLYELLQNAVDSGATKATFQLDSEDLVFSHDGFPFTENDVDSISFVNSSTKPPDNIGFMGIGFKAAFEICDQPEIHSPPFCFRFDRQQAGDELLPIPTECTHPLPESHTTTFRFPLKGKSSVLISDELERFDGRLLLYIGADLKRVMTPNGDFSLHTLEDEGEVRTLEVREAIGRTRKEYAVFGRDLELTDAAWEEFASNRKLELSQFAGRKQRVSIAISLNGGLPDANRGGRLQVYLPTDVRLPFSFDVQGNFLVGASRKELRHAFGPWNREHFQILPALVADVLEWTKARSSELPDWASWYDLIPDWRELEERIGLNVVESEGDASEISLSAVFASELSRLKLMPAIDHKGSLVFVTPEEATAVDDDLYAVLSARELSRLSGSKIISPSLSKLAKERLTDGVKTFGYYEFMASIEGSVWASHVDAFSEGVHTRQGRRQLAKVLAYLERKWPHAFGLRKCTVVMTQDGNLRAAAEKDALSVRTLPDGSFSLPTEAEELAERYEIVHQGFRRELSRPGEMDLDPDITRDAVKALERVAPRLDPPRIAEEIILPLFKDGNWREVPDGRLLLYTRFLMQHSRETMNAIDKLNFRVKVRGPSRKYLPPGEVYFGGEYSLEGDRLDQLCAGSEEVYFLSEDYLDQVGGTREDWKRFFSRLGITDKPRIASSTAQIYESHLDRLREATEEPGRTSISLRASYLDGIRAQHYALDDFVLDPPIRRIVQKLYREKPPGWKDKLRHFAAILEAGWGEYKKKIRKELRYAIRYSSSIQRNRVTAQSSLAEILRSEPWLPVLDASSSSRRPCEVVLNTEENRRLAHKETPLSYAPFSEPSLISFLEIKERPLEVTPLERLHYAVYRQEEDLVTFEALYHELAGNPGVDANFLRQEFRDNSLIFVPNHDPKYVTSKEAVFASRTSLAPRMAAIKDTYPNLEEFFTESIGIPTTENLEITVSFLRDYVWKDQPNISDNLRTSVESCYRRFFNYLNQTDEESQDEVLALLKEQFGTPTLVFCGALGWVDTTGTTVLYPDTAAYEGLLSDAPGIAIESHLKRLAQPLNEIRSLLDALNVKPMSEAVRREPEIGNAELHSQSDEFGERLSLLVRKAVAIVERERAKTESVSRNVNLFLQEWERRSEALFGDIRFFESPLIKVSDVLVDDDKPLREMRLGAYVSAEHSDHLRIYMSGDLLEVFDSIADQLRVILRLDLLPTGLRDDIASLVQSNLARLGHEQFGAQLRRSLAEKGFPVEEDEELKRILQSSIDDIEAEAESGSGEQSQGSVSSDEGRSNSAGTGGSGSGTGKGQSQSPPKTLTPEDILAKLPDFDESGFGSDSVVDLSVNSDWQNQPQQNRSGGGNGGSGAGGGGNFKSAQAYREAYGIRGEQWVLELEVRALRDAGKLDLAERVVHKSQIHEGSPWDIESFEKSHPYRPIYVEVKSTPDSDNLEVEMSAEQIRTALHSARPYFLYRVLDVDISRPTVYIYDFKKITTQTQFSATNVSVILPRPEEEKK